MANYNKYAAGSRVYGLAGRPAPNYGAVDKAGYRVRDNKNKTKQRNNAILRRMQAKQKKKYMTSPYLAHERRVV